MQGRIELNFNQGQMAAAVGHFLKSSFLKEDNFIVNEVRELVGPGGTINFIIAITATREAPTEEIK